jgi:hypothetical protein
LNAGRPEQAEAYRKGCGQGVALMARSTILTFFNWDFWRSWSPNQRSPLYCVARRAALRNRLKPFGAGLRASACKFNMRSRLTAILTQLTSIRGARFAVLPPERHNYPFGLPKLCKYKLCANLE